MPAKKFVSYPTDQHFLKYIPRDVSFMISSESMFKKQGG